ncbi:endoribonuclease L-PSP [Colletotrichum orchidophilum]|uniref:Endoribonuclease L-PSP n=1 Tax=Colletotrichum orchidophilum TaxID=1209926 RepID=A0A1G4APN8_9PEZI|nr:endoribonuclease L-PSP [Colletotrichum orchidophilum]OHE91150.1 endoribonuclease L-PSP [Colletotrichum orchidophilum]
MTTKTKQRTRVPVRTLPSWIPTVPPLDGEENINAAKEAAAFLERFSSAVLEGDWDTFGKLFAEQCFWKDHLTLTFDKRTIHTRDDVVAAWEALSKTRRPSRFTSEKDGDLEMDAAWVRLGPTFATLDVPFSFRTEAPKSKCIGLAKLIPGPEGKGWQICVLTTAVVELEEKPFSHLPRTTPSSIEASQRGKPHAQGLPHLREEGVVLDAVIVGGSCTGIANAIQLDAAGADVVVFDAEAQAGGNWSTQRYETVTLHHPAFMIQLPQFPVPAEGYPNFLTGLDLTRYFSAAVEELRLPFFAGVAVVSNAWSEADKVWTVRVKDVKTGEEMVVKARNVLLANGFIFDNEHPRVPELKGRELFHGPIQHTTAYRNPKDYKGKRVVVVGSGNSAHDVAGNLASDPEVESVTLLQRSPTVLLDFATIAPILTMRYQGDVPIDTADFLQESLPVGIMRDMGKAAIGAAVAATEARSKALEGLGYVVDRNPCLMTRVFEDRGKGFYVDQPGTFDFVFGGRIKIAQGEAVGFVEEGVVVVDKKTGKERVVEADGVVLATGYEVMDLPKKYRDRGFFDEETAGKLVNVSMYGVDEEGEVPGLTTFSGHPNLYFAGVAIAQSRTSSRLTAVQVLADITGQLPERYPRNFLKALMLPKVERTTIAGSIEIPRILNGLWQLAGGHDQNIDVAAAAEAMVPLIQSGLDGFDMADHYGPAELVIGHHNRTTAAASQLPVTALTKWCPAENGDRSFSTAEAAVDLALGRMGQTKIALMQYHVWDYTDDTYLCNLAHLRTLQHQGKIAHVGLTNVDAAHVELLLHSGYDIATNQVSCSVVDRRLTRGRMAEVCARHSVGVLAYGTLLGGFLTDKWVGTPEPADGGAGLNWSLRKYLRFIQAAGGWDVFQRVLGAVADVAGRHGVSVAAVAMRWVLDIPVVKAVIIGARLNGESGRYAADNLAAFGFSLDEEDRATIAAAQTGLTDIPGDCGDEYRRPPFLTASGDLSHHIEEREERYKVEAAIARGHRVEYRSGSKWEPVAGYSRAVRIGDVIRVSGTTANPPSELRPGLEVVGGESARSQAVAVLDTIEGSLKRLGGGMSDVVRTRVMLRQEGDVLEVSEAHGWAFKCHGIRPANTTVTAGLIGNEVLVEIEVEAEVGSGTSILVLGGGMSYRVWHLVNKKTVLPK